MEFHLNGTLHFNTPIDDDQVRAAIASMLSEANTTILAKGAPEGKGASVQHWSIEGTLLHLELRSFRFVRAHDGLIRLKKFAGEKLGRQYHLGVRKMTIEEYRISFAVGREPLKPLTVPFAEEVMFENTTCTMVLRDIDEEFLRRNYIDRMISLINDKIEGQYYEGKTEHWELVWASEPKDPAWTHDPTEEMVKRGWLKQGPTKGKWFFRPQAAALLRAMEYIAIHEVLLPLGFQEVVEPHHVPFEIWERTGHMVGIPNEVYYICEPRTRDIAAWEPFIDHVKITREIPTEILQNLIAPPNAGSCYAQCPVIYWSLAKTTIASESLPVLIFDRAANSNRYESGGRHGIERVDEFHRIEPVYIGTPEQMVELKNKLIERYKHVFNDILEIEWRMAWVTPFYMAQSGQLGVDAEDGEEKLKGTIDFEAYMPYRGAREESEWLEFQNLSILGTKFTKAFNIKTQKGELWSGCSGIGLERWMAVFTAQKGLDPKNWPERFKAYLPGLPKGITLL